MKFRTLFILFNVILIVFLAILCLTPTFLLGAAFASAFWRSNWFLVLILAAILVGFDSYFIINRQLYALLEREDWPALVHYLEDRVVRQGKYNAHLVRLLANTYLVLSDSPSVMSLENKAAIARPSLVENNALIFGAARILGRDIPGAVRFFETRVSTAKPAQRQWMHWYHGFALLLNKQYEKSAEEFSLLARSGSDGVTAGLAAFFLADTLAKALPDKAADLEAAAAEGKERVLKSMPQPRDWARETTRICTEIHAAALSKYMEESGAWLYKG
ncbi:hypothetical protein FACS189447_06240 [Spirochaetia bacterium]|nr:hypothetical protein FACS189447_06240 [Spirochaetia bacterium]